MHLIIVILFWIFDEGCWRQPPVFNGEKCYATSLMPSIWIAISVFFLKVAGISRVLLTSVYSQQCKHYKTSIRSNKPHGANKPYILLLTKFDTHWPPYKNSLLLVGKTTKKMPPAAGRQVFRGVGPLLRILSGFNYYQKDGSPVRPPSNVNLNANVYSIIYISMISIGFLWKIDSLI